MPICNGDNALNISEKRSFRPGTHTALASLVSSTQDLRAVGMDTSTDTRTRYVFQQNPDLLQCSKTAAQWIELLQWQNVGSGSWLSESDRKGRTVTMIEAGDLFKRIPGTILFFVQLANATGDARYLRIAARGADLLMTTWRNLVDSAGNSSPFGLNLSFSGGLAGVAYVLNETGKAAGNHTFREASRAVTDSIVRDAKSVGSGFAWSEAPGITGDGGIVLYLLYAAREFDCSLYGITAQKAGDHILEIANNERHGGFNWSGFPAFPGLSINAYTPGFEDGSAGITYLFARLFSETKKSRYLFAARQGALYLERIAARDNHTAHIFDPLSDPRDAQYSGFCHGPAGTARAFVELYKITCEPIFQAQAERLAQAFLQRGDLNNRTPEPRNTLCQCCGSVATIDHFIDMWATTGRLDFLAIAQRAARQLVSREENLYGTGNRKLPLWPPVKPWDICAQSSYEARAAGVGTALLRVHLAEQGRYGSILRLDNPSVQHRRA